MTLLDAKAWDGQVYSNGWTAPRGGDIPIVEPATGAELGRTGLADADDVARAAGAAAAAQKDWAAAPFTQRAAVLRKAGDLISANADELAQWVVRETGAVPGLAGFAVGVAAQECYDCLLYTSPSPRDRQKSRMPSSA